MKYFVLLFCALFLIACNKSEARHEINVNFVEGLHYFKDMRTNTCFARNYNRLAYVPCENIPTELLDEVHAIELHK